MAGPGVGGFDGLVALGCVLGGRRTPVGWGSDELGQVAQVVESSGEGVGQSQFAGMGRMCRPAWLTTRPATVSSRRRTVAATVSLWGFWAC